MANRLQILVHTRFFEIPLEGLALYNNEKVYFLCISEGGWNEYNTAFCPASIHDEIQKREHEEAFVFLMERYVITKEKDGEISVCEGAKYEIYRLPSTILEAYEADIMKFSILVGKHTHHTKEHYKPFDKQNGSYEAYNNNHTPYVIDIRKLELLCTCNREDFDNFLVPSG